MVDPGDAGRSGPKAATVQRWDRGSFRWLAKFRTGLDRRRVTVWYSQGELVALATGKVLAKLEGLETVKPLQYSESQAGIQLTASARKLLVFKDPTSSEYMEKYRYRPTYKPRNVAPIALPEQLLVLQMNNGIMQMISKHVWRPDKQKEEPIRRVSSVRLPDVPEKEKGFSKVSYFFHTTLEQGIYSYEKFDYTAGKQDIIRWTRIGQCPSWYGPRQCTFSCTSKKLASVRHLPRPFQDYLEKKFPDFLDAPGEKLDHLLSPSMTDKKGLPSMDTPSEEKRRPFFSLK